MDKLKILFLTPFHFEEAEHDDEFDTVLTALLNDSTEHSVVVSHLAHFESDDTDYELAQTRTLIEAVAKANSDGFDAVIVGCHYDPAVNEVRAVSRIPVIAPLQLTAGIATQFGPKFAVITDIPEAVPVIGELITHYGYGAECTGVHAVEWEGDAILDDPRGTAAAVDRLVDEIASAGEAQAVVIGCTIVSSAYERHRSEFPDRGVKVLNSNLLCVKSAAALAAN